MRFFSLMVVIFFIFVSCSSKKIYTKGGTQKGSKKVVDKSDSLKTFYTGYNELLSKDKAIKIFMELTNNNLEPMNLDFLENQYKLTNNTDYLFILKNRSEKGKYLNRVMKYNLILKNIYSENGYLYEQKNLEIKKLLKKSDSLYFEALNFYKKDQLKDCRNRLRKAIDIVTDDKRITYLNFLAAGKQVISSKNSSILQNGVYYFDQAIEEDDSRGEAYYYKAIVLFMYNKLDYENIVENFDKALERKLDDKLRAEVESNREKYLSMER
ncbi:MAG: hypothetical protein CR982_09135 [Candidatus Cloacimonadota bacterium]|nr:MAG: hypothetical protein CR982_09135 [Candidatus Cloacimonadota bacterium]